MSEASRGFPDSDAIFGRALCLAALLVRGLGEDSVAHGKAPAGGVHGPLQEFIAALELNDELAAFERRLIEAPLGSLTNLDLAQLTGLEDALRTLLWALGVVDERGSHLMPPEEAFEAVQTINGLAADPPSEWKPRDRREIARAQRVEDVWLWCCRVFAAEREANAPEGLRDRMRGPLRYAEATGYVDLIDDDIVINGKPFSALSERESRIVARSAQMRSVALLWLLGIAPDWDRANAFFIVREQRSGLEPPDFITPPPPSGAHWPRPDETAVAERVIALSTLLFRRQLEHAEGREAVASRLKEFEAWLRHPVVAGALSPKEGELINRPPGSWTLQQAVDAGWRLEALGCLLWAISQLDEMPAYDTPFPLGELLQRSNFLDAPVQLIAEAMLRPKAELDRARSVAETWHWRDRTAQLVRAGRTLPPGSPPVPEIISVTARAAYDNGDIPPPIDDDFPAFGKAYRLLPDEERSLVGSIARERHYAFNWLCGYAPDWDHVRTDT